MLAGAIAVVLTGEISLNDAFHAINPEVMLFLFGMFVVGEAVCMSGILTRLSYMICRVSKTSDQLLFLLIGIMATSSAVLMNDTIAIIGTPFVLSLASRYQISPKILLLTLCFSLTTGSVCSPIGNPQNLLLATYWNLPNPFLTFGYGLIIPTVISLALVFFLVRSWGSGMESSTPIMPFPIVCHDSRLVFVTLLSLVILGLSIILRIISSYVGIAPFPLSWIAVAAAVPILCLGKQRDIIIRGVDWRTLIFFSAMFVLMQSVYETGWFQSVVPFSQLTSVPFILVVSVILSQFISNVPFIALFEPVITQTTLPDASLLALAAGSTIAGNLTILGAASNIIVIQKAEQMGINLTFREFLTIGLPLTLMQGSVYALWLLIFHEFL